MDVNHAADRKRMLRGFAILVAVYLVVVFAIPRPAAVKPEGWRLTGIFAATIVGSIIDPIPAGALVLAFLVDRFNDWSLPLHVLSALYLVAAVCWLLIRPERHA